MPLDQAECTLITQAKCLADEWNLVSKLCLLFLLGAIDMDDPLKLALLMARHLCLLGELHRLLCLAARMQII
jgi:hypothetical protein